ncbi:MAG: flavin oxidoreductase, partial [Pseudomonadota bacterium]
MENIKLSKHDIQTMEQRQRTRLVNSLAGYKSANLIGTRDRQRHENLA